MSVREDYIIPYRLASRDMNKTTSNAAKYFTRETLRVWSKTGEMPPGNKSKDDAMSLISAMSSFSQASGDTPGTTNKFGIKSGLCKPRNSEERSKPIVQGKVGFCKPQVALPMQDNYARNSNIVPNFPEIDVCKLKRPLKNKVVDNKFSYFNKFGPCSFSANCSDSSNDSLNFFQDENIPGTNRSYFCNFGHKEGKGTKKCQSLKQKGKVQTVQTRLLTPYLIPLTFVFPIGSSVVLTQRENTSLWIIMWKIIQTWNSSAKQAPSN